MTNNKAVERSTVTNVTVGFFAHVARSNMSPPEIVLYDLRIEREALVRSSAKYHRERLHIQQFIHIGPDQDKALAKLHTKYPLGYCKAELAACNAAIVEATAALHRFNAGKLAEGGHLDTRRANLGR